MKRDGTTVPFNPDKIRGAVRRCFDSVGQLPEIEAAGGVDHLTVEIARKVVNLVAARKSPTVSVEDVQRLVIQQLWGEGLFEAAEHYQNYRESRRQAREKEAAAAAEAARDSERYRLVADDARHFPSALQYFQFIDKYARWRDDVRRRETWRECCDRVIGFFRKQPQLAAVTPAEWSRLDDGLYNHRASPAMRVVQMAGPALDRCNTGVFNCCYTACDDLLVFSEVLYLLMQGCGVGFSVEADYVDQLPRIRKQRGNPPKKHIIPDSTEGWCNAYRAGVAAWAAGEDVEFDYSRIRPHGSRLKTKGGRASGPEPLRNLLTFVRAVFLKRQGRRLTTRDCHDILCMTGKIVQMGGVRRASEISLSDLDDVEMRDAKSGRWRDTAPWLDMANNSAVYDEKPDAVTFMEEWLALAKSGSGERGIFNRGGLRRQIPARRKFARFGVNPCGEVLLRSCQMCVSGSTPLLTRDGLVRIGEAIGREIEVWNGKTWSRVTPFQTGRDQQLMRVTFSDGSYLDCTPDHRFSVSTADDRHNNRPLRTVQARDLKPRMATETFRIQHTGGTTYADAYTLGVLFGDGHRERDHACAYLFGAKQDLPVSGVRGDSFLKEGYNEPCVKVDCGPQHLELLEKLRADDEHAWRSVFTWDRASILALVAGVADTDGSNTSSGTVRVYVSGRTRADWIQLLLTKCGIRSSVNLMQQAGAETNFGRRQVDMWYVQITECVELPCHRLDVSGGHEAVTKGKFQTVRTVEYLPGRHDSFCFTEPHEHKGVFNNTLTYQCNLSIVVARYDDTPETLEEKVTLAAVFGTLQSTLTNFTYVRPVWKENCDEERLLGVDITGQMDCPLLRPGAPGRGALLDHLRQVVLRVNAELAARLGIPASAAATVVKPSGNSAEFFGCSSGLHARWSTHRVRRVRVARYGPVARFLAAEGVPHAVDPMNDTLLVFDFLPDPAPAGTPTRNDLTAVQQFKNWLDWKVHWTEHNPSCTIYVGPDEWMAIGHEVYANFDQIGGLSFLPRDSGTYQLAPNEELSEEEYTRRRKAFPDIRWERLGDFETEDETTSAQELACVGGACEL